MAKSISGHQVYPYEISRGQYQFRPGTPLEYYLWGITGEPEVWVFRDRDDQHALLGEMLCTGFRPNKYHFLEPKGTLILPINELISDNNIWGTTTILFAFNPVGIEYIVEDDLLNHHRRMVIRDK